MALCHNINSSGLALRWGQHMTCLAAWEGGEPQSAIETINDPLLTISQRTVRCPAAAQMFSKSPTNVTSCCNKVPRFSKASLAELKSHS